MGSSNAAFIAGVISIATANQAANTGPATTERTAKSIAWPTGGVDQAAELTSLRTAISSGNTIFANDLNRIGTLINNMNGHYHTYDDVRQIATFGNAGDRATYILDKNTNSIDSVTAAPTNTVADTSITASRHNELKDAINNLRSHSHGIFDNVGSVLGS
jgi:hypothetical protein